jgi:hypothetical protein
MHYPQIRSLLQQVNRCSASPINFTPERFVRRVRKPVAVPTEVWINKPLNLEIKAQ